MELIGFREWRVEDDGDLPALHPLHNSRSGPWPASPVVTARCCSPRADHPGQPAPVSKCTCGIHAWSTPRETLDPDFVVGAIAAWGRIEVHLDGFRAEHARVVALSHPYDASPRRLALLDRLAARYGATVCHEKDLASTALMFGRSVDLRDMPLTPLDLWEAACEHRHEERPALQELASVSAAIANALARERERGRPLVRGAALQMLASAIAGATGLPSDELPLTPAEAWTWLTSRDSLAGVVSPPPRDMPAGEYLLDDREAENLIIDAGRFGRSVLGELLRVSGDELRLDPISAYNVVVAGCRDDRLLARAAEAEDIDLEPLRRIMCGVCRQPVEEISTDVLAAAIPLLGNDAKPLLPELARRTDREPHHGLAFLCAGKQLPN